MITVYKKGDKSRVRYPSLKQFCGTKIPGQPRDDGSGKYPGSFKKCMKRANRLKGRDAKLWGLTCDHYGSPVAGVSILPFYHSKGD